MLDKLNFYDLLGHLLPGGAVVALGYWLVSSGTIAIKFPQPPDLAVATLLLGASYLAGHLIQSLAEGLEHWVILPIWRFRDRSTANEFLRPGPPQYSAQGAGAFFANQLLSESHHAYPRPVIELIRSRAESVGFPGARHPHVVSAKQLFDLCQGSMLGSKAADRSVTYLAISGLSRGMLAASILGILVASAVARHDVHVHDSNPTAFIVIGVCAVMAAIWYRRFRRFAWYFVDQVWTGFASGPEAEPE